MQNAQQFLYTGIKKNVLQQIVLNQWNKFLYFIHSVFFLIIWICLDISKVYVL